MVQEHLMTENIECKNIALKTQSIILNIGIQKNIHTSILLMKIMQNIFLKK